MKTNWLVKGKSKTCILFFNGWGMDEHCCSHLESSGFDICTFHAYDNMQALDKSQLVYEEIHVVAWSLGVSMANLILGRSALDIHTSTAINGTTFPMHEEFGIPTKIFRSTLDYWSEANAKKFNMRMFGGQTNLNKNTLRLSSRPWQEQKRELQFFYDHSDEFKQEGIKWDLAILGKQDRIIPFEHQNSFWSGRTSTEKIDWPHFPFDRFESWGDIIKVTENAGKR